MFSEISINTAHMFFRYVQQTHIFCWHCSREFGKELRELKLMEGKRRNGKKKKQFLLFLLIAFSFFSQPDPLKKVWTLFQVYISSIHLRCALQTMTEVSYKRSEIICVQNTQHMAQGNCRHFVQCSRVILTLQIEFHCIDNVAVVRQIQPKSPVLICNCSSIRARRPLASWHSCNAYFADIIRGSHDVDCPLHATQRHQSEKCDSWSHLNK